MTVKHAGPTNLGRTQVGYAVGHVGEVERTKTSGLKSPASKLDPCVAVLRARERQAASEPAVPLDWRSTASGPGVRSRPVHRSPAKAGPSGSLDEEGATPFPAPATGSCSATGTVGTSCDATSFGPAWNARMVLGSPSPFSTPASCLTVARQRRRARAVRWNPFSGRVPQLAKQPVQLTHIQTGLAIVLPSQLEQGESILVGRKSTVDPLVQIDEAALNYEEDQRRFW